MIRLELVRDFVRSYWQQNPDVHRRDRARFETAILELFGELIERHEPSDRIRFTLTLRRSAATLSAAVCHDGPDIVAPRDQYMNDPTNPAISGRGFPRIELLTEALSHERDRDRSHWHLIVNLGQSHGRQ